MVPTLDELEGWYTTAQAAHAAGRSRQGVINLAKDRKVRAVQVGRSHPIGKPAWIFDPKSIKEFVEKEQRMNVHHGEERR